MKKIEYSYDKHEWKWWHLPLLLLLIAGTLYVITERNGSSESTTVNNPADWKRCEGTIFGTIYHITYNSPSDLKEGIMATLDSVDNSLSPFNKKSTITAINENTDMHSDRRLTEVFQLAQSISKITNGAFDITVAPLVNLWGFGFKNSENVTDATVDSIRTHIGYTKVRLQDGIIVKDDPQIMLDCSAIAKGYGVDEVGRYLEHQGVTSYMVEIGGEVRLRGSNPKGIDWTIGVSKPVDDSLCTNTDIQQVISTTDMSMATSGNYRNFYIKDNKKYAHTIDPRTGYPVQHNVLSATVLARDCAMADAFATSFMVLGLDSAKAILTQHSELMGYLIYTDKDGKTAEWSTDNLKEKLKPMRK